ncbi:hypothetical protein IGB42_01299 [Andreprevotia sp. IGB-42]|uniref:YhdP family protein n=1 Tax=Andreprevotia sp. IGB-42 TaxID=2497473 RepID=UPI0013597764|nr:YhdP family protein [Andreprevotia sp. IGB-42]KAF0814398.1 hypothetical protein IGB42_01299 [Andreprevotia sp. IGB-42]
MTFGSRARRAGRIILAVLAWHSRLLLRLLLAVLAIFVILALVWQFYLLPRLDQYRPGIVAAIAKASGSNLSVAHLTGGWAGIFPRLKIDGVTVRDAGGQVAVELASIDAEVSWSSLLAFEPHFHKLALTAPRLAVVRDQQGVWHLGGFALREGHGKDNHFIDWLLAQGELSLSGGEITWHDMSSGEAPQTLSDVRISISKLFSRHRFSLAVTPPSQLASPLLVDGNWYGNEVAEWREWRGVVNARMSRFDLTRLARWLPAALQGPVAWQGQGGGEFSLSFAAGKAEQMRMALKGKNWQGDFQGRAIRLAEVDARMNWRQQAGQQRFELQATRIDTGAGPFCRDCSLTLKQDNKQGAARGWTLEARDWQLAPLTAFVPLLPSPWKERLVNLSLKGDLKQIRLRKQGGQFDGEGEVEAASIAGYPGWPAASGMDVSLRFDARGGQLQVASEQFRLAAPDWFTDDLNFKVLKFDTDWQRDPQGWHANMKRLQLQNDDVTTSLSAHYTASPDGPGFLDLTGEIPRLSASRVSTYLPREVGADTLAWLRQALTTGEAYDGKVVVKGDLAHFPFAGDKGGLFRITAKARDTALKYAEGWPAIEAINGELDFHGTRMEIHGRDAGLFGTRLSAVSAIIPDLDTTTPVLQIDGQARGPTREFLRFLKASPIRERTDSYLGDLKAEGDGDLQLKLDLPLANIEAARIAGQYRFVDNQFDFGASVPRFANARGRVAFTEKQMQISDATAQALGGPLRIAGGTDATGGLRIAFNGQAQLAEVAKRFELPLASRVRGAAVYQGTLSGGADSFELALQSPLTGVLLDLPAPLGKLPADARPLRLKITGSKAQNQFEFAYDKLLQGLLIQRDNTVSGQIGLNRVPGTPAQPGVTLVGGWREVNLDGWRKLADEVKTGGDAAAGIISADLSFGRLAGWGYALNDVALKLRMDGNGWLGDIASREVTGKVAWNGQNRGKLSVALGRLLLPLPEDAETILPSTLPRSVAAVPQAQHTLPAMDLHVEDFRYKTWQLGKLDVDAVQQGDIWRLNSVSLVNPDGKLSMTGLWRQRPNRSRVEARFNVSTDSLGKLLTRLDYPDTMKRAPGQFSGDLAWEGDLFPPDLSTLEGSLKLDVQAGQFSKIAPGAARFLSILSLQSLTRRVQLDFRDVFSEGFEFDTITGEATIQRGQAHTENLIISGPAAQVLFRGDANFVAGTQNLRVRIVPVIGDSVAVATTLINPIAGAAAFLLQRILKDPLGQLVAYEYDITGTMRDPQITPNKQTLTDRLRDVRPR